MSTVQQRDGDRQPISRERGRQTSIAFRCSPELKKALRVAALQQDKSMEQLCTAVLDEYIRAREQLRQQKGAA